MDIGGETMEADVRFFPPYTPSGAQATISIGLFEVSGPEPTENTVHFLRLSERGPDRYAHVVSPIGESEPVDGGQLLFPVDTVNRDEFVPAPEGVRCVAMEFSDRLLTSDAARTAGDVVDELHSGGRRSGLREALERISRKVGEGDRTVAPRKGLGDLLANVTGDRASATGSDDTPRPGGIADVFPERHAGASPPVADARAPEPVSSEEEAPDSFGTSPTVCGNVASVSGLTLDPDAFPGLFTVGAMPRAEAEFAAIELLPFTDEARQTDARLTFAAGRAGQLQPIALPNGIRARPVAEALNELILAVPTDPKSLRRVSPVLEKTEQQGPGARAATGAFRLAIFADGHSLSQAGVAELERDLLKSGGAPPWVVDWFEPDTLGRITAHINLPSINAATVMAATSPGEFFPQQPDQFEALMRGFEETLVSDGPSYDQVIWVLEGHVLPHNTPGRLEEMIERVNELGRVTRFPDGRARKWLQVIAGQFSAPFSAAYLDGPLKTTRAGYLTIEDRGKAERTVMLLDQTFLRNTLSGLMSRAGSVYEPGLRKSPMEMEPPPEAEADQVSLTPAVDAEAAYERIGLVLHREGFTPFVEAVRATRAAFENGGPVGRNGTPYRQQNALTLVLLRSNDDGQVNLSPLTRSEYDRWIRLLERALGETRYISRVATIFHTAERIEGFMAEGKECDYLFVDFER
ncbi:hypothetical protein KUV47_09065 [Vannielia litorea]|uniref:hypothetical protein n=1 Tax=Vannielia litorea TaxID=1217970 RepID=UPI001C9641CB|nr:hypothetical protein [Vannielia litorea]MBY6153361.1 hypothetical protein [Vannielia litorea]